MSEEIVSRLGVRFKAKTGRRWRVVAAEEGGLVLVQDEAVPHETLITSYDSVCRALESNAIDALAKLEPDHVETYPESTALKWINVETGVFHWHAKARWD